MVGKDQFRPIVKWLNKSSTPLRTLLLTYHTKLSFDLLQKFTKEHAARSSSSSSGKSKNELMNTYNTNTNNNDDLSPLKRARNDYVVVDLTEDSDDEQLQNNNQNLSTILIEQNQQTQIQPNSIILTNNNNDNQDQTETGTGTGISEEHVDDEVIIVTKPKCFALIDITDSDTQNDPVWSSVTTTL